MKAARTGERAVRDGRLRDERRTGWRAVLDSDLWRQAFAAGTAGAVSMAVLAGAVTLARDTTGHDWYAAARLTAAELLIAIGFDETAPTGYRTAAGAVETVSRYGLTVSLEARWAREDILAAARDGAVLGALSGLGGALLCLALVRRSREERPAPPLAGPRAAASAPETAAPGRASQGRAPPPDTLRPAEPDPAGAADGKAAPRRDDTAAPARRRRERGRWV